MSNKEKLPAHDVNDLKFSPLPEIHDRRYKVMRLRFVQKWSVQQIVQALGEQERTIYRDIEAILKVNGQARQREKLFRKNTNTILLELEAGLADRQRERWQEYHEAKGKKDGALARRILNDIAEDEERHIKHLQSIGVVEKAAENVNVTGTVETWPERLERLRRERAAAAAGSTEGGEDDAPGQNIH